MEALEASAGFTDVRTVGAAVEVRFADLEQRHAFTWSVCQLWTCGWARLEGERDAVRGG